MNAFLTALLVMVVIGGGAAAILTAMPWPSADVYQSHVSVRLDPAAEAGRTAE